VLHATVPAGDFFLDTAVGTPVVLVSGGVGLTPMVSMLETIVASQPDRPTWWVHGALNGRVHAMRGHVRSLAAQARKVSLRTVYAEPLASDRAGIDYDTEGFVSASWLAQHTPLKEATYYVCGPKPFLRSLIGGLTKAGVPLDRLRYEFFGPADEVLTSKAENMAA
jgi:nitric oxide dioxygenase